MGRSHPDRLVQHDPAMDVALVAPRLAVAARLPAVTLVLVARLIIGALKAGFLIIIFFRSARIGILLLDGAVGGRHDHQFTLPYLPNPARGLSAPQVFAVISLFVPLRRIVRQRGS